MRRLESGAGRKERAGDAALIPPAAQPRAIGMRRRGSRAAGMPPSGGPRLMMDGGGSSFLTIDILLILLDLMKTEAHGFSY
jgi:hypothetical protein